MSTAEGKSPAGGHPCPKCGSTNVKRSQRRGIHEAVVLKREGLSPYRCRDCEWRFIERSLHPGGKRSRAQSWASVLGIRDAKQRRRFGRLALTAVLTLLAVVVAYLLFEYFTRPVPPADAASISRPFLIPLARLVDDRLLAPTPSLPSSSEAAAGGWAGPCGPSRDSPLPWNG